MPSSSRRVPTGSSTATSRRPSSARGSAPWTAADLALVDEARDLLEGHTSTYGHVIVDEAQDLSPMQLRMIGRRAPSGSVTVLGDLAQATAAWTHTSWADVAVHLQTAGGTAPDGPIPESWRSRDLTLGYRVPGLVLDFAAQLLPEAAPMVAVTESVRVGRRPPRLLPVADADLFPTAVAESAALAAEGFLVGCIVAGEHVAGAASAFGEQGVEFGTPERDGILKPITLLPALTAKGLEFDAVVVVEPVVIVGGTARGLRLLYVALTRPIQHLSVVHAQALPDALRADVPLRR